MKITLRAFFRATHILAALVCASSGYCDEKNLEALTASYSSVTVSRAPLWIAKDLGLFERYGLDAKLVQIPSGNISISALLAGDVQLISTASSSVVAAAAQGAPLVIVATHGLADYKLVAHPSILSINELKGKTIGVSRFGTGPDFLLRRVLAKLGLDADKEVTIIPTGLIESEKRMMLMLQRKIDATIAQTDSVLRLELEGQKVNVLADFIELGVYSTTSDLSTTRQVLKDRPNVVKAFLMAMCEGIWRAKTDRDLAFRIFRKYLAVENPKLLGALYKTTLGQFTKPYPLVEAIQGDIEFLGDSIPLLKGKRAPAFMDVSTLKQLETEGFFARLRQQ
jgi:ABC-type nitrate/sulfonate/bicarbonate transport system substrate-binding protein